MTAPTPVKLLVLLLIASPLVLTSCDKPRAKKAALPAEAADLLHEVELIDGYYSSDVQRAEASLLGLAEIYSSKQFETVHGVKSTRALTHARLYLLYSETHRTDEATVHRAKVLSLISAPAEEAEERWSELLNAVEALDKNLEVKWKVQK
jgi:hypothetical protein